jgi:hypothetical protein
MWFAYKSKELAVMLPAALAAYEWWLAERRWKRLLPFFAVSLLFGLQALLLSPHHGDAYSMVFTPGALAKTARFYESKLLLFPVAGLAVVVLLVLTKDRRVWCGLAIMLAFLAPLTFLPGRLFSAYAYVPLVGAAIAVSALALRERAALVAVFFALWLPWNIFHLRLNRRSALTIAEENRRYVQTLGQYLRSAPDTQVFVYDGRPFSFAPWGIEGAIRWFTGGQARQVYGIEAADIAQKLESPSVALLSWDPMARKLSVVSRHAGQPDATFLSMDHATPIWQLGRGWHALEEGYRWIEPVATAWLRRPPGARAFEATFNLNEELLSAAGKTSVELHIDGAPAGWRQFTATGRQTARWALPGGAPGKVQVEFHVTPGYQPPDASRRLGIAVISFGFRPQELT